MLHACREWLRSHLREAIYFVMRRNPELHYYQGFHDVACVFLLAAGAHMGPLLLERVAQFHLRDAHDERFERIQRLLSLVFPLVERADRRLWAFLSESGVHPSVALPWVLTWFAHHFDDFDSVCRLYDFFLAAHPLAHVYASAAVVVERRAELLALECDYSAVHGALVRLPQTFDVNRIVQRTVLLLRLLPPDALLSADGGAIAHADPALYAHARARVSSARRRAHLHACVRAAHAQSIRSRGCSAMPPG